MKILQFFRNDLTKVAFLVLVVISSSLANAATVFWTEDFEAYSNEVGNTIHQKDTTWEAFEGYLQPWTATIEMFDGDNILLRNTWAWGAHGGRGDMNWWNDTSHKLSGFEEFAFSVYPVDMVKMDISIYGLDGSEDGEPVVSLAPYKTGSPSSLDMFDDKLGWVENGPLLVNQWNRVSIRIDFGSGDDDFWVRVNDGT